MQCFLDPERLPAYRAATCDPLRDRVLVHVSTLFPHCSKRRRRCDPLWDRGLASGSSLFPRGSNCRTSRPASSMVLMVLAARWAATRPSFRGRKETPFLFLSSKRPQKANIKKTQKINWAGVVLMVLAARSATNWFKISALSVKLMSNWLCGAAARISRYA